MGRRNISNSQFYIELFHSGNGGLGLWYVEALILVRYLDLFVDDFMEGYKFQIVSSL